MNGAAFGTNLKTCMHDQKENKNVTLPLAGQFNVNGECFVVSNFMLVKQKQ